jgi:hypothetical protein
MGWLFLSCAAACLAAASALAASSLVVNQYVKVQPIQVCIPACSGRTCTSIDCSGVPVNFGNANAPVGFWDSTANDETSDEILTNELTILKSGVLEATRVTFLPVAQYASPVINTSTGQTFQTLYLNSDCTTSNDFDMLAQQQGTTAISTTGTVPNPTTPPGGNKTCSVSNGVLQPPCVPVNTNPAIINMFFVKNLSLAHTSCNGTVSGIGKINGNGVAIASPVVFNSQAPEIDVIGHELSHNLSLNHVSTVSDLMAPGSTRTSPTLNCNLASPPCLSSGLAQGTVDQLNSTQAAQVLDPSGFVSLILEVKTSVTAAGNNTFNLTFSAPAKNNVAPVVFTTFVWEVPSPLGFAGNGACQIPPGGNPQNFNIVFSCPFNGNLGSNSNSLICGGSSIKCVSFGIVPTNTQPNTFGPGDSVTISVQISSSNKNIMLSDLTGSTITYIDSASFATTSAPTSDKSGTVLNFDSVMPAFNIASFVADPNVVPANPPPPCSLAYFSTNGDCPNQSVAN